MLQNLIIKWKEVKLYYTNKKGSNIKKGSVRTTSFLKCLKPIE